MANNTMSSLVEKEARLTELTVRNPCPVEPPTTTFQDLIPDVVSLIFRHLDCETALSCRLVSKAWKSYFECDLHMAAHEGDLEAAKTLIGEGRSVNKKLYIKEDEVTGICCIGSTPLHFAAFSSSAEHIEIGKLLIDSGANVDAKDDTNWTPVHHAATAFYDAKYSGEFIKVLLKAGADTEVKSSETSHETPLMTASSSCSVQSIENLKILIEGGANIHVTDQYGNSPFHSVNEICDEEKIAERKVRILIDAGANVNSRNHKGNTPMHHVVQELLYNTNNCGLEYLQNHLEILCMLLAAGGDKEIRNGADETPLEYANSEYIRSNAFGKEAIDKLGVLFDMLLILLM